MFPGTGGSGIDDGDGEDIPAGIPLLLHPPPRLL